MLEEVCRGRGYSCGASDALVATAVRAPRDEAPSARSPSRTPSSRAAAAEHSRGKATRRPRRRSPESGDATARCAARHAAAATRTRRDDARACAPWLRHRRGGCVSSCPLLLLLAPRRARARVGGLHRAFCARCAVCVHQMRPLCQRDAKNQDCERAQAQDVHDTSGAPQTHAVLHSYTSSAERAEGRTRCWRLVIYILRIEHAYDRPETRQAHGHRL